MRIVIIGGVAAGTSAAAKARRNDEKAEIVVYERDSFISYSGCGMPYYLGGKVEDAESLLPRDPLFFKSKYNVDIIVLHEVIEIQPEEKRIVVKDLTTGIIFSDTYDKLIIATGASAVVPPIKGADSNHVFTLRNMKDMHYIKSFIDESKPATAVIIGSGFIGLEMCDNLKGLGIDVTLIEKLPQVTPGLDGDVAVYVRKHLIKNEINVLTSVSVVEIKDYTILLSDGKTIIADMVLLSTGVRPNTELAAKAGIVLGVSDAIKVNNKMETNISDIYACGDCIEQFNLVTGKKIYRPLGSTANKTGRIAGDNVTGGGLLFRGILGTGIFKLFDMTVAQTGLSEVEAIKQGYEVVACHNIKPNKAEYMGGREIIIKGIADKVSGRLLGAQIVGFEGVDKRIDIFVTAITFKALVEDLFHLDLAYAPPFSTTKDPVMYTGMILDNAINHGRPLITPGKLKDLMNSGQKYVLIDARTTSQYEKDHIHTAKNIPHVKLRESLSSLEQDVIAVTYCNKGVTGNAAQNILINNGFKKVYNLSGGHKQFYISKCKDK